MDREADVAELAVSHIANPERERLGGAGCLDGNTTQVKQVVEREVLSVELLEIRGGIPEQAGLLAAPLDAQVSVVPLVVTG